ncbi:MAG TPA: VC0807 family protein [Rhizomicrobium sp.]|jgi:hypothetical protein|nr:VC0807 family protein [Rhizomicrobium sp.]
MSRIRVALEFVRDNGVNIAREILVNLALPYLIYTLAVPRLGEVNALIASSLPPILWSIFEFARHRKIDALSIFVVLGIGLSLLAFFGGGSAKFLQLREKLVTACFAAIFLGSAAIGRPLIYELARAGMARGNQEAELKRFESLRNNRYFRATMMIMTLVWGLGLLADVVVSVVLVFRLSIKEYLIVNPIIGYATMGTLSLWTFWYARRRRRQGEARRAAEASVAARQETPGE